MKKIFLVLVMLLTVATHAQEGRIVERIDLVPTGKKKLDRSLIIWQIETRVGDSYKLVKSNRDLKRLYGTGYFKEDSLRFDFENIADNRVIITIHYTANPTVNQVKFVGNDAIATSDLEELVKLNKTVLFNEKSLFSDRESIIEEYTSDDRHGVSVEATINKLDNGDVDIIWTIVEREDYQVNEIKFEGNANAESETLEDELVTSSNFLRYLLPFGFLDPVTFDLDKDALKKYYGSLGYLDMTVDSIEQVYDGDYVDLTYVLTEGPLYHIGICTVEGNDKLSTESLMVNKKGYPESGDVANKTAIEARAKRIQNEYYRKGYADARCVVSYDRKSAAVVDIIFNVKEGKIIRIGDIKISGTTTTQDKVILRESPLLPNDLANRHLINLYKTRLKNTQYFKKVEMLDVETDNPDVRDLYINLDEKPTGEFSFGGGFSTDSSGYLSFEMRQENFDISKIADFKTLNVFKLRGAGQKILFKVSAGDERSEARVAFTEPYLFNRRLQLQTDVFYRSYEYDEFTETRYGVSASISQQMKKFLFFDVSPERWTWSYGFTFQRVKMDDFETGSTSPELLAEKGTYWDNEFNLSWRYSSLDRTMFPTRGFRFSTSFDFESEAWGAYSNIYTVNLKMAKYIPITKNWTLKLSSRFAQVNSFRGDDPAIFDRLFAGGQSTLRGFDTRDVGPIDSFGDPMGGSSMFLGTVEMQYPISESLRFVLFSDVGNVWEDDFGYDVSELNVSVGVGLRIMVKGLPPISLDYGIPVVVDQDHLDENGKFEITFSVSF